MWGLGRQKSSVHVHKFRWVLARRAAFASPPYGLPLHAMQYGALGDESCGIWVPRDTAARAPCAHSFPQGCFMLQ